ncbi:hypothetical protein [Oscillibacter sp.]|uniref:hypothetical protein n=1 Tax=Oscillibacter sp. TaxID=1945593 RepID=UPI00289991A6|nr:hypothetical protein [Oscillibacter sp.]
MFRIYAFSAVRLPGRCAMHTVPDGAGSETGFWNGAAIAAPFLFFMHIPENRSACGHIPFRWTEKGTP